MSLHELNSAGIWIKQIWIRLVSPNLSWSAFELKRIKVLPHWRKSCLFRQIFCHHQQLQKDCRYLTNFVRSGQIFKCTLHKVCPGQKLDKLDDINKTVINLSTICRKSCDQRVIELKSGKNVNATDKTYISHAKMCSLILSASAESL